jgi:polyisoprenoid-binding protein YceI
MRSLFTLLFAAGLALAETYDVRPTADSRLALTVEKTGLYRGKKHVFLFEKYEGRLQFDPQHPETSKIDLTIDSRSAVCKDDWVSAGDLKKIMETTFDDMLAVKKYPSMTFSSSTIRPLGGDNYEASGTLTIRDLAKPVTVMVHLDPQLRLTGSAKIRLTDYKLKPPSAILGAIGTKDEMTLNFTISAAK